MSVARACRTAALTGLACLLGGAAAGARAAEFEIAADSFTVVNQVNISSATYFQARAIAPPDPALATQLLTPGGLYFDATYYNVWDRTSLAWVKLATGTAEAGRVAKAGDFMSGQLTTASTITVQGNAFSVGASTFVVIGGNVGVGTTDLGTNAYNASLTIRQKADDDYQLFLAQTNQGTGEGYLLRSDITDGDLTFSRGTVGTIAERVRFTAGGNVGVGTVSPSDALHVYRDYDSAGSRTNNAATLLVDGAPGKDAWLGWGVGGVTSFVAGFDNGEKQLDFWGHNDTSWNHTLAMTTTGQVGIGTRFPYSGESPAKLDVRGRLFVTDPGDIPAGMYISRSGGPTADWNSPGGTWGVYRYGSAQSDRFCIGITGVNEPFCLSTGGRAGIGAVANPAALLHVSSANAVGADTILQVSSGTSAGQELLVVKGDGKVGVGTASPGAKLEVSGDIKASNFQNSWTSYTPTTSLGHTGCVGRYIVMGKIVYVQLYVPGQALTTTAASWSISLPLTSAANLPTELARTVFINASSTRQAGLLIVNGSASSVDVYNGPGLGVWSPAYSGSGLAGTLISYPID